MTSILVTGGAGFIGSNFIPFMLNKYPSEYSIVNLDALTYAGNLENLKEVEKHPHYNFVHGDIRDRAMVKDIFRHYRCRAVIHFAAESHVDNSITGPEAFITTNVLGTFTLLDVAKEMWKDARGYNPRFLHISTDEVYGSLGETGLFTERTPYAPNSPYSASKASSDMIVRSYHHTYGLDVVTTNCSNNYGPKQHKEKLIPTIIRSALAGKEIPIYGDGKNVRDWLYVGDHVRGINTAFHLGKAGETYNIGGKNEKTNNMIAKQICDVLDQYYPRPDRKSYSEQITYVADRAGHDRRYAIDATKITSKLGWAADVDFEDGIKKTVQWYVKQLIG